MDRWLHVAGVIAALAGLTGSAEAGDGLDSVGHAMLDPQRAEGLKPTELIARLRLPPTAHIADVGAGPGFLTLPLARAVPRGRVLATDVRADYLAVAAERSRAAGLRNIETRLVGVETPGLEAGSFDLVVLCQVDHYLADRARYLAALVPSLRRGGRIAVINYARYREADLAAARAAGLRVALSWAPTPPFFLLVLDQERERP